MLWSAFLIGLLGSYHCIGMCGPLALALPVYNIRNQLVISRFLYNAGRTLTYGLSGAAVGSIGYGAGMAGMQQMLSIIIGVAILLILVFPRISQRIAFLATVNRFNLFLKQAFAARIRKRSFSSVFLIGVINGFLPCGLVYLALAGAMATGSVLGGALYMIFFGLGVFPLMFVFSLSGGIIGVKNRNRINRVAPFFIAAVAILFILRGLNLGIPYVSPRVESGAQVQENIHCH